MQELLERLASGVLGGPDDLMGIGDCLNLLDEIECAGNLPEASSQSIGQLKQLFNRVILGECTSLESEWASIRTLIDRVCLLSGDLGPGDEAGPNGAVDHGALVVCQSELGEVGFEGASEEDADWRAIQDLLAEKPATNSESGLSGSFNAELNVAGPMENDAASADCHLAPQAELQDPGLIRDFLEEAHEHLASIELSILSLEEDPGNGEAINAVFRPFHSVKGVAGFLNLTDIHGLSHEVENLLDDARSGRLAITNDIIDLILQSVDLLKVLLGHLSTAVNENQPIVSSASVVSSFVAQIRSRRDNESCLVAPSMKRVGEILVERGVLDPQEAEDVAAKSQAAGTKIGEALVQEGLTSVREVSSALREQRTAKENASSVRIDTQKLESLVDMVGELVIAQSMVLQNPHLQSIKDQKYQKDSVQLRRITNELQRISMSMRMVPIKSTFQKMIRLVRDLCKKSGKEAILEMRGEETEIDRNMVEEIYEPLVHMIRNSIDHGIEPPEERARAGKDPVGRVLIAAEQKGGNILIDIKDDGRGIDVERVRAKAMERGIIAPDEAMDHRAVCELIFHPGFSTKETITDVSGRGVGMDVVKKSVEALKGKIEIINTPGRGTHFQFKLPLTTAIIDGMIIHVGTERYVVPTISLKESFRPGQDAYSTVHGLGETIMVRETLMPLLRLHEILGVEPRHREPWEGILLVVSEDGKSYCFLADEIIGRQEVVIKSLGSSLKRVAGVSGGAILGDGRVALILDVKGIVSRYEGSVQ
ncbi:MAG: chemotaxis protein CheA [Syntrophobacteraceae bacterium]|jgi:two-component system chemotaxis sensor kinase CheA|nr:chemotaxis protein CheA [Syntrophobacteraceae bacterium]